MNIFSTVPVSFPIAALGGEIVIDTVDGKVIYEVKPGTQTDTRVRLKGKGVPSLRNKDVRGDQYVTLVVQVPDKLSHEAKELLAKFDAANDDSLNAAKRFTDSKSGSSGSGSGSGKKKKKIF
jgi:molecular chaperone DnaJ